MNHLINRMEAYLSTYKEIRQFQTSIYNARQASINVYFTRENERSGFPYTLKSRVISKALELGGGSWGVWGLMDQGFSNDVRENAGSFRIEMYGYNYDELYEWAEKLREKLLTYRRIKEVLINSEFSWWKDVYKRQTLIRTQPDENQKTNHVPLSAVTKITPGEDLKILTAGKNGEYIPFSFYQVENAEQLKMCIRDRG